MKKASQSSSYGGNKERYINSEYYRKLRDIEISLLKRSRYSKSRKWINALNSMMIASIIGIIASFLVFSFNSNIIGGGKYVNSNVLKHLSTAIQNNGDLEVVKNIYSNREFEKIGFKEYFSNEYNFKYNENTPLSELLYDLRTEYYLNGNKDSVYLQKLNQIIYNHNIINPFDKLEENQKNDFENLRLKLGQDYIKASSDINRITEELYNKNQLVTLYLDKSTTSFWISIIALIITFLLSIYQIYQNRKERTLSLLKEIVKEIQKETPEKEKQ